MGIMTTLRALVAPVAPLPKLSAKPDDKSIPGQRIHHEYFVAEVGADGRFKWECRVYAANGEMHQMTGSAESDREARIDAIKWADDHKAKLRGA
jgi:hypothetical protein